MSTVSTLAFGPLNNSDNLAVELVSPPDAPTTILIKWPDMPTVCPPARFPAVALAVIAIMDDAMKRLTAIEATDR